VLRPLSRYLKAAISTQASQLGLPLSVLLHGALNSGRKMLMHQAASSVGISVMELECYDLVGETDVKNEGLLRARIERAIESAPCVLLLTNIEALARKSQAVESGQGTALGKHSMTKE